MDDKRGMQHIEFIVSFVIFVTFLILAFYFFSPVRGDRIVDSTLFYTSDEIAKNVSINIESFSVNLNKEIIFEDVAIPFSGKSGLKVRVEDVDGNVLTSGFSNNLVHVSRLGNYFFVIHFSEDFQPDSLNTGTELGVDDYTISSSEIREVYSEKKLNDLKEIYDSEGGYDSLKDDFNLPERGNFGFVAEVGGDNISAERNIPEGLEIFSQNEKVEILRSNGEVDFAEFRIIIW